MVSRPENCDPNRLRRLLDDRLDDLDHEAMAEHLESCEPCRRKLDGLAAESRFVQDARAFLAPEPTRDVHHGPGVDDASARRVDATESDMLGFLAPSDDPEHLGRLGSYEVVETIGRGGMGLVLKALDPSLNRFVAIKVLAPELSAGATARRRFAREGRAAAAIVHDHIVAIHAVDASGGLPYLVMQYVSGKSLQERLDRTGPLAVEEVVRIGMQAALGLAAAHEVGLIHRDIKPSNILLENGVERVKISDFGLARAVDDASLTQSGIVAGTPQYMSPEQARGEAVDHRTDLFSLGSVLYALCTGRPPFRADTTMAVLRRVSDDTPRPIRELNPDVPDWLAAIVAKLHAKDPAGRFASAEEVADLLGRCLVHLRDPLNNPPPFAAPTVEPKPTKPRRRRLAIAGGLAALLICGLGAAEAAGLTDLAGVLRIKTAKGTIVLEVEDPEVKVRVDGEDVVLTGLGVQELRVTPGQHKVDVVKGDKVATQLIEITRDGKKPIKIGYEPNAAAERTSGRETAEGEVKLAEAELARAKDRLEWAEKMIVKGFVSQGTLAADRVTVARSELNLRGAKDRLDWAEKIGVKDPVVQDPSGSSRLSGPSATDNLARATAGGPAVSGLSIPPTPAALEDSGTPPGELAEARIKLAEAELARVKERLDWAEKMRAKGYVSEAGVMSDRIAVQRAEIGLREAKTGGGGKAQATPPNPQVRAELAEARLKLAEAELQAAKDRLKRSETMHAQRLIADGQVEADRIAVRRAEVGLLEIKAGAGGKAPAEPPTPQARVELTEARLKLAEAELQEARDRLKRSEKLHAQGLISEDRLGSDRIAVMRAELERARVKLEAGKGGDPASPLVLPPPGAPGTPNAQQAVPPGSALPPRPGGSDPFAKPPGGPPGAFPGGKTSDPLAPSSPTADAPQGPPSVLDVALDPDGKSFAAACSDGTIRIWDLKNRAVLRELKPSTLLTTMTVNDGRMEPSSNEYPTFPGEPVWSIAYTPDGKTLVAGGGNFDDHDHPADVLLYDVASGNVRQRLAGHSSTVLAMAISPDGKRLVTGGWDRQIRLWDLPSGRPAGVTGPESHSDAVHSLAFAPDGESFASASFDGTIKLWKADGSPLETLPGSGVGLNSVAFSPDGRSLASGGKNHVILYQWGDPRQRSRSIFTFQKGDVLTVAFSPDGKSLAAGGGRAPGNTTAADADPEARLASLRAALKEKLAEVNMKRKALLATAGKVLSASPDEALPQDTIEELRSLRDQLVNVDIEVSRAEATFLRLQNNQADMAASPGAPSTDRDLKKLFDAHPKVVEAKAKYDRAKQRLDQLRETVQERTDPSYLHPGKDMKEAQARLDDLWKELEPSLAAKARGLDGELRDAATSLTTLMTHRDTLAERMAATKARPKVDDAAAIQFVSDWDEIRRAEAEVAVLHASIREVESQPVQGPLDKPQSTEPLSELRIWEVATGRPMAQAIEKDGPVEAIVFTPEGKMLVAGGTPGLEGYVALWDLLTAAPGSDASSRLSKSGAFPIEAHSTPRGR